MRGLDGAKSVASFKEKFPISDPEDFYAEFPRLTKDNHTPTSRATPWPDEPEKPFYVYNCLAFAVGDKKRFWWPGNPGSYWPRSNGEQTVDEIASVLREYFGYKKCDDGAFEKGVRKLAIFENYKGEPSHVAVQPANRNGKWVSKMGYNIDMEHDLHALETRAEDTHGRHGYGKVARYLKVASKNRR
jgi:hypothetical protein